LHEVDYLVPEKNTLGFNLLGFCAHRFQDKFEHLPLLLQSQHSRLRLVLIRLFYGCTTEGLQMQARIIEHSVTEKYLVHGSPIVVVELQKVLEIEEGYSDHFSDVPQHLL